MAAQQQCLVQRFLQIPMRRLNTAILMAFAAIVARARHAIVLEQRRVAAGEVLLLLQILERRRQTVGAVLARHATGFVALTTFDHLGVLPARES